MDDTIDLLQLKIDKARSQLPAEALEAINGVGWQGTILSMRETKGYSFEQLDDLETETELLLCGLTSPEEYQTELENTLKLSKGEINQLLSDMDTLVFKKIMDELVKNTENKKLFVKKVVDLKEQKEKVAEKVPDKVPKTDSSILSSAGIEILDKKSVPVNVPPPAPTPVVTHVPAPMPEKSTIKINIEPKKETMPEPVRIELNTTPEKRPAADDVGLAKPMMPVKPIPPSTPIVKTSPGPYQAPVPSATNPILAQKLSTGIQTGVTKTEHTLDNIPKTSTPSVPSVKPKIDPYREIPE